MIRVNKEIADQFVKDLKEGILQDLLQELKNDNTLMLDFRNDYINIYYRGGWVCYLEYKKSSNSYKDTNFNPNYVDKYSSITGDNSYDFCKEEREIKTREDCKELIKVIQARKQVMNYHKDNENQKSTMELENKQIIIRENNYDTKSNYTIVDTEYHTSNSGQFDMIGVSRKGSDYNNLKLAIIELKYGTKSFNGESGVYGHFKKITRLTDKEITDLKEDAAEMLKYKIDLGLIKMLPTADKGIEISNNGIELIYFISDIAKDEEEKLRNELAKISNDLNSTPELKAKYEVKIFCPYLAGNVMFGGDMIDINTFLQTH